MNILQYFSLFYLINSACSALEFIDFEDPLYLLWEKKNEFENGRAHCSVPGTTTTTSVQDGICLNPAYCLLTGGRIAGYCSALTACCLNTLSCDKTTSEKVSYFQGTADEITSCHFTIRLNNPNVCQVRLDFIEFDLQAPEFDTSSYSCVNYYLDISPNTYGIPRLCGQNKGQHVYVHVNNTNFLYNSKAVHLNIRANSGSSWNIKATQLECPKKLKNLASRNIYDLAPLGAIQYFTDYTGTVRSFDNYQSITNEDDYSGFTGDQYYAIAFKRYENVCGVSFAINYLQFSSTTAGTCNEYLFIPEGQSSALIPGNTDKLDAYYCPVSGTLLLDFTSKPPGPLYIHFNSRDQSMDTQINLGFELTYELISNSDCTDS